jgi:hypothetical protein
MVFMGLDYRRGKMRKYLGKELDAIYRAYAAYDEALKVLQAECPHDIILEAPRQYMEFFNDLPPIRICEQCGTEEDSSSIYSSRFNTLTGRAYMVKREEVYANRPLKTYIPEEIKENYAA